MPRQQCSADSYRRTRRDHATETAEDYVEAIARIQHQHGSCRVVDLARQIGVSHVTVTRIVARLHEAGLVHSQPYRPVTLTTKGKRLATRSRRRHEIVYRFLVAVGVDPRMAVVDAEGIEHHVSPQTLRCFERFVRSRN